MTRCSLRLAGIGIALCAAPACSPQPQSGTNTNWACKVDTDCTALGPTAVCREGVCTKDSETTIRTPPAPTSPGDASSGAGGSPPAVGGSPPAVGGAANGTAGAGGTSAEFNLSGITATDEGWIAVGHRDRQAIAYSSRDAVTWVLEDVTAESGHEGFLGAVAFGNGTVVALGESQSEAKIFIKPPNGTWQFRTVPSVWGYQVVFGNGAFLISPVPGGGGVSNDGINWTPLQEQANWAAFVDGQFVGYHMWDTKGGAAPVFRTSLDGHSWSEPTAPSAPILLLGSLALVDDKLLGFAQTTGCQIGGRGACKTVQLSGPQGTSPATLGWSDTPWAEPPGLIVSSSTRVVLLDYSKIRTTSLPLGSSAWSEFDLVSRGWTFFAAASDGERFVAAGRKGSYPTDPLIATSTDGSTWVEARLPK
jgi:hypothetical protein